MIRGSRSDLFHPVFVVDERDARWRSVAPFPNNEIEVCGARSLDVASDKHRVKILIDQVLCKFLRPGDTVQAHFVAPRISGKVRWRHALRGERFGIAAIEDIGYVDVECDQDCRLKRASSLKFPECGRGLEASINGGRSFWVETPAIQL